MATSQHALPVTLTAGSAISIYRFVAVAADGKVDHVGSANGRGDGVAAAAAAADGDSVPVITNAGSIVKVEAGAAVTRGALVASDNVGRAIDGTDAGGNFRMGIALQAASAAGEIIEVLFQGPSEYDA